MLVSWEFISSALADGEFPVSIRIAIGQVNPRLGDLPSNLALYEEYTGRAAADKAELLLFPELSLTGYMLRDTVPAVALKLDSPEIKQLMALSRRVAFVAGLVEESADHRFFNSAVYFEDGQIRHVHRKVYLPTYGMFDEQRYFARGGIDSCEYCRRLQATWETGQRSLSEHLAGVH